MKKALGILFAVVLLFGMAGMSFADVDQCPDGICADGQMYFEDLIDKWCFYDGAWHASDIGFDAAEITQNNPLTYTHDSGVDVNQYEITEAWLELDFTNDLTDDSGSALWGLIKWDYREYVKFVYDGSAWVELGEVDNGQYTTYLDVQWLNDDGLLDVTIKTWNALGCASAWLDHSKLYGCAAPVPEPSTMLLLGAGLLGLVAYGRKRIRK